jgi:hypothetical protein
VYLDSFRSSVRNAINADRNRMRSYIRPVHGEFQNAEEMSEVEHLRDGPLGSRRSRHASDREAQSGGVRRRPIASWKCAVRAGPKFCVTDEEPGMGRSDALIESHRDGRGLKRPRRIANARSTLGLMLGLTKGR